VISATDFGGGIAGRDVNSLQLPTVIQMTGLTVTGNFAELAGGGVWLANCDAQLRDSSLNVNGMTNGPNPLFTPTGGGLFAGSGLFAIERNVLLSNESGTAGAGSALVLTATGSTFVNNIVAKNWVHGGQGAGVWLSDVDLVFVNDTFAENNSSNLGLFGPGTAVFVASAVGVPVPLPIVNCILRGNLQATIVDSTLGAPGAAPLVSFSNLGTNQAGNWLPGPGLINAPPRFVDPVNNNFHINPTSPSRDAGINTAPGLPLTDIDGQPRIQGVQVDQGADEVG
jgi:hypothetical protein